jgi:hypothetical protein
MNELKNGDVVYVSDCNIKDALSNKNEHRYIGKKRNGMYMIEDENGNSMAWKYAVKKPEPELANWIITLSGRPDSLFPWRRVVKPEPKIIPWTIETVPLPPFCVRNKKTEAFATVIMTGRHNVFVGTVSSDYEELFDEYDYVISRDDIRPCGIEQ